MRCSLRSLCQYSILLIAAQTFAQKKPVLISGDFKGLSFEQLVKNVEDRTPYHFFYNPRWTDTLAITLKNIENAPLQVVLDSVFSNTSLKYSINTDNNVYITLERSIYTDLPVNFFGELEKQPQQQSFDFSDYEKREKKKKSIESKLFTIGSFTGSLNGTSNVAGHVRNASSGEPVVGASVFVEIPTTIGVSTDQFGYYSITLPKGRHELKITSLGMKNTQRQIMLYANGKLNIELDEDVTPLKEVVVESDRDARVTGMQMGMEKLDIKTMKQMPSVLGEIDVLKVALTLPGVQSVGEGTSGLNIRGGTSNQNLILFNDAVVYNPAHVFGFFSAFNPDVLKNVELYKSGINAEYGGRLSSVLDVTTREGNLKKFSGAGGISPVTGRLTLEGPIIKDKTSFLIGGRSTYSNWLLKQIDSKELQRSEASFYDVNFHLSHKFSDKNSIYLSSYLSQDKFRFDNDTLYNYTNRNSILKWKYIFNNQLYGVLTGGYSGYDYTISSNKNPVNSFQMQYAVKQWNAKTDFSYFPDTRHTINAGGSLIRYSLSPGNLQPEGSESLIVPDVLQHEHAIETAVYGSENYEVSSRLSLYLGVRYSFYQFLGPHNVLTYQDGASRSENSIQDTVQYAKGKPIATYHGAEPRVSVRYIVGKNSSVKFSYNKMRQYIQMLSNTTAISPTDTWKLSDAYLKPQVGDQFSIGFYRNFRGNIIETSIEAYHKTMKNSLDYKDGAVLLLNHHIETDVVNVSGKAYGVEFLAKKAAGKLNGWVSYAYSRTWLKTTSTYTSEIVNHGKYYRANYDKPHAFNFIGNYKFNRRFNFSLNTTYSTGRPITIPLEKYDFGGAKRLFYSERNAHRIPDYFRVDLSINVEGNHRIKKLAHSSWTLSIYNVTGRDNAYSVFFVSENGQIKGYKLSVFAKPIPSITYNFKF